MSSTKKGLIQQLSVKELRELLNKRGLKAPSSWKKRELGEFVNLNFSRKDIESSVKIGTKAISKEAKGYASQLKGIKLEDKILKTFTRQGYTCEKNVRTKRGVRAEFDVTGYKDEEGFWETKRKWVFAECKNKSKVIPSDWKKFLGNFNTFKRRKKIEDENITGYLYTTGLFDPGIRKEARLYPNIQLKRIKLPR